MMRTLLLALLPISAFAAPVTFELDPAKTELLAFTEPTGIFKGASHSHCVEAKKVSGKIVYDADAIAASSVTVSFPVDALVVDEPTLRKREGMTTMPSEKDRKEISAAMFAENQLNLKKFASIGFESTAVKKTGDGKLEVSGRLGIHGLKKDITVPVSFSVKDGVFRGEGTVTVNHKDFGIEPITAVLGTVRNAEPIRLKILLVGTAHAPAPAADAGP